MQNDKGTEVNKKRREIIGRNDASMFSFPALIISLLILLKITPKKLNSHGNGFVPIAGNDSDEFGEYGRVYVISLVVVVVRVPFKFLQKQSFRG